MNCCGEFQGLAAVGVAPAPAVEVSEHVVTNAGLCYSHVSGQGDDGEVVRVFTGADGTDEGRLEGRGRCVGSEQQSGELGTASGQPGTTDDAFNVGCPRLGLVGTSRGSSAAHHGQWCAGEARLKQSVDRVSVDPVAQRAVLCCAVRARFALSDAAAACSLRSRANACSWSEPESCERTGERKIHRE
jgi:hypothetical protein